jgi:hypothetical protein
VLLAALMLLAAAPVMAGSTEENRDAAVAEADALVSATNLPPDAAPTDGEPAGDGEVLKNTPLAGGNPNVAIHTAWFRSSLSPEEVLAYTDAHPPAGATLWVSGGGKTQNGRQTQVHAYQRPRIPGRLGDRRLMVSAARLDDGTTGIRVDGYVVWLEPRPAEEVIPPNARRLTITARGRHTIRINDPARVKRIAGMVNLVDIFQPGVRLCERALATTPHPRLVFRTRRSGPALAIVQVVPDGCPSAAVQIGGHQFPSLDLQFDPGPRLLKALKKIGAY